MRTCTTVFTKGECDGHYGGKFDDCLAEALYALSLDNCQDDMTGACDFEGHLALFLMERTEGADVDGDGKRLALIPPGNYILFTASSGAVSLWQYETKDLAVDELARWAERYDRWAEENDY